MEVVPEEAVVPREMGLVVGREVDIPQQMQAKTSRLRLTLLATMAQGMGARALRCRRGDRGGWAMTRISSSRSVSTLIISWESGD